MIAANTTAADALVVLGKETAAEGVVQFRLGRPDGSRLPDWTPGSHIDVVLPDGSTRQYSLCGDPRDAYEYRIAVLRDAAGTGGSVFLHDRIAVGDTVRFGGPRNNFRLVPAEKYTFIAGGIGVTPILAMATAAARIGAQWRLLYLGRRAAGMAFTEHLVGLGRAAAARVRIHPSAVDGRVDLDAWIGDFREGTKLYACGPEEMLTAIGTATAGWRPGWVRFERFAQAALLEPARTTPFEVSVAGSDRVVRVDEETTVAAALRDAGFSILTSCSRGVCATCETRVIEGEPDHRDAILDDRERAESSTFFPCVSRARSDRLTLQL